MKPLQVLLTLILMARLTAYCPAQDEADSQEARDLWRAAVASRAALPPCDVTIIVKRLIASFTDDSGKLDHQLDGSTLTYRFLRSGEKIRVDGHEDRPGNPASALDMRYAYDGDVYRVIAQPRPGMAAHEYLGRSAPQQRGAVKEIGPLDIDVRSLGMYPAGFQVVHSKTLEFLQGIEGHAAVAQLQDETVDNRVLKRVTLLYQGNDTQREFLLDPKQGLLPVVAVASNGNGVVKIRDRMSIVWKSHESPAGMQPVWFPETVQYEREQNGEVKTSQTWQITSATFSAAPDDQLFEWSGLQPLPGTLVIRQLPSGQREFQEWDGVNFIPWDDEIARRDVPAERLPPAMGDQRNPAVLIGSIAAAILCLVIAVRASKLRSSN